MPAQRDYFAELYVAGLLADAGWNVYFPHRDRGMDFLATMTTRDGLEMIRPVQVKGKYPSHDKTSKTVYGYIGRLNQIHPDMILAIPFFGSGSPGPPLFTAFMSFSQVRRHSRGYRCQPASFKAGRASPRRDFRRFVDEAGLQLVATPGWSSL